MRLFRRRYIPNECIELKDDEILCLNDELLVTRWRPLKKREDFAGGISVFFFDKGLKVSRIVDCNGHVIHWYCDIVDYVRDTSSDSLTCEDLLLDVIVYPDGHTRILDCDEAADALDHGLISSAQLSHALRSLDDLLRTIAHGEFKQIQDLLESYK